MFRTDQYKKMNSCGRLFLFLALFVLQAKDSFAYSKEGYRWGPEFGLGYSMLSGDSKAIDRDKSGYHLLLGVDLNSYYGESHLFEASLGLLYNYFQTSDGLATLKTVPLKLELGYRYRLGKGWQLGPALAALFATDVSFAENPEVFTERQEHFAVFLGAKLSKEVSLWDLDWRVGGHLYTDLTLGDRQIFLMGLTVALELPFGKAKEQSPPEEIAEETTAPSPEPFLEEKAEPVLPVTEAAPLPVAAPIATVTPVQDILLNLDSSVMQFRVDIADLDGKKPEFIRALGLFLQKNPAYWQTIRVYGHADATGNAASNQALSEDRAKYVGSRLTRAGIDSTKIKTQGFGSTQPLDPSNTPEAWSKNRRVEIYLDGTKKPDEFVQSLNQYLDKVRVQLGM